MRGPSLSRAALLAGAAACLFTGVPDAIGGGGCNVGFRGGCIGDCGGHPNVMWRHRGLGEGCVGVGGGVRRFHGLGDGYWSGSFNNPFLYYPNQVIVVVESPASPPPERGYIIFAAPAAAEPAASAPPVTQTDLAWWLLDQGRPRDALREFAILSLRDAGDGGPRVGYGLACAMLADNEKAAWAFRRALAVDPPALHARNLEEPLSGWVRQLIEDLPEDPGPDGLLLIAALHTVLHEDAAAVSALERAATDPAAPALRTLLGAEAEPPAAVPAGAEQVAAR